MLPFWDWKALLRELCPDNPRTKRDEGLQIMLTICIICLNTKGTREQKRHVLNLKAPKHIRISRMLNPKHLCVVRFGRVRVEHAEMRCVHRHQRRGTSGVVGGDRAADVKLMSDSGCRGCTTCSDLFSCFFQLALWAKPCSFRCSLWSWQSVISHDLVLTQRRSAKQLMLSPMVVGQMSGQNLAHSVWKECQSGPTSPNHKPWICTWRNHTLRFLQKPSKVKIQRNPYWLEEKHPSKSSGR